MLAIPWSSIAAVAAEGRRGVVIHVRAFAPAGTLHFEPAANVDRHALLAALADHVDRARAPGGDHHGAHRSHLRALMRRRQR
ncbi:MAG: hypothetical protein IPN32_37195 [Deltaproteobacteria bacterium]|nr:hypothetical protein [Deltaproteobacteria bacterium]